ncbi:hypothetical protein RI543_002520 [Arxiozyma heterogenica]|uniref:non-specific serine/threonine protein kinase n=1 Tax=Arxiozyma heterogenica TaxID=278026 RepID=A0AAN7WLX2_9SACH|nr:hypothetical protein RI543_002520 [Kazachstania heterogenica]
MTRDTHSHGHSHTHNHNRDNNTNIPTSPRLNHHSHNYAHHTYHSNNGSNSDLNDHLDKNNTNPITPKPSHSMSELKRFFRSSKKSVVNLHHLATTHTSISSPSHNNHLSSSSHQNKNKNNHLHGLHSSINHHPYSTTTLNLNSHLVNPNDHKSHTNSAIPPSSDSVLSLSNTINIYHDDTILAQKYGKLGKTLGSGAGGSVKVLVRPTDGATFAVKEFRPRKQNESIKQYAKKCTAEFCIGSSLHHPNIVQTIDIFSDFHQNKYFQVMEYLPVDFFSVVMTGLMSRGEINCCFKQIASGVKYLHSMGLAHRDLKLDNCVMNTSGILKLIDFGSAMVFRYPFEDHITMAHGIVGSDPYLAPEVLTSTKSYDPQFVDVWSMGIIFCCMMLKRFPWKAPKMTDENFKLYSMPDDFPHDYVQSAKHHEQLLKERRERREQEKLSLTEQANPSDKVKQLPTPTDENDKKIENDNTNDNDNDNDNNNDKNNNNDNENDTTNDNSNNYQKTTEAATDAPAAASPKDNKDIVSIPKDTEKQENNTNNTHQNTKPVPSIQVEKANTTASIENNKPPHHQRKIIHGPYRLLRLLPHASRPILSRILEVDVSKRATLDDIFNDEWFSNIPSCTIDEKNNIVRAPGHHHTIVKDGKTYKI